MRVLMFGWEFPPFNSGGLGVACEGLLRGLTQAGSDVTFVLPRPLDVRAAAGRIVFADNRPAQAGAAGPPVGYLSAGLPGQAAGSAVNGLLEDVIAYARRARGLASKFPHDVIHAHDWLSFPAGLQARGASGKPLVVHVHATEFDRTGDAANPAIVEIERRGLAQADRIIAVSAYTKEKILSHYGVAADKVDVVHNAIDDPSGESSIGPAVLRQMKAAGKKIVLFVGRLTLQKGPDYFMQAARKIAAHEPRAIFVVAGAGDMERRMIEDAARFGLADRVLFTGFIRDRDLARVYRAADVFVMPSVSEPFGITCLESLSHRVPAVISRQSGVAEAVSHCLKIDFWDIDDMAAKILAVLRYPSLQQTLAGNGQEESGKFRWPQAAEKCLEVYRKAMQKLKVRE